jgi:hypothetical protein
VGTQGALRSGDRKFPRNRAPGDRPAPQKLADLRTDVAETRILAAEHPARLADLARRDEELDATMRPPLWGAGGSEHRPSVRSGFPAEAR